jgi:hypothetical protein
VAEEEVEEGVRMCVEKDEAEETAADEFSRETYVRTR